MMIMIISGLEFLFILLGSQDSEFFFRLPKRVNRGISCIATKVRKLQIYLLSFYTIYSQVDYNRKKAQGKRITGKA